MPKPKVPYHCKVCGDLNPKNFYKDRKNLCKTHFKELVSSSKCDEEKTIIEEQVRELDNQDVEIAKRDEQITTLENRIFELDNYISSSVKQLQKDLDFNVRKINQHDNKIKDLISENKELKKENDEKDKEIIALHKKIDEILKWLSNNAVKSQEIDEDSSDSEEEDNQSVKSEKSVKSVGFNVPVIKTKGSAEKKGMSADDINYYKNRLNGYNGKDLRDLAKKLHISVSKPKPQSGNKTVDVLRKEIKEKLNSWL